MDEQVEWSETLTVKVVLDVHKLAEIFSGLDDDQQARFFVEVAAIMSAWKKPDNYRGSWMGAEGQFSSIGGHLRNCACSTEEAREMIRSIAHAMEHSTHGITVQP